MTPTAEFVQRLGALQEGERSRLRRLAGQPLNASLPGFDLFTGLWWPLRQKDPKAPQREASWMVAKLFGASPLAQDAETLPRVLGLCEPRDDHGGPRFRSRSDAILCSSLSTLEPHLRWGLAEVAKAAAGRVPWARGVTGIDWVQLLDDLSFWDREKGHEIRDRWAEQYLNAADRPVNQP